MLLAVYKIKHFVHLKAHFFSLCFNKNNSQGLTYGLWFAGLFI